MKKTNFTKLMALCLMFLGLGISQNVQAQCADGTTEVTVTVSNETFDGENGWILYDATAGATVFCANTGGGWNETTPTAVCVTNGNTIELYTYESFGDGWQGGNVAIQTSEDGSAYVAGVDTDGDGILDAPCGANDGLNATTPTFLYNGGSIADDNDMTDGTGNGGIDCANPTNTGANTAPDSGPVTPTASFVVECVACLITCPGDIVATTDPGTCDGGFVNVPLPSVNADCVGAVAGVVDLASGQVPLNIAPQTGLATLGVTPFTIAGAPTTTVADVAITGVWNSDNSFGTEIPILSLEGTVIGTLPFGGADCQENDITMVIPMAVYNAAAADGSLDFSLGADGDVNSFCATDYLDINLAVGTSLVPYVNDFNGGEDASGVYPKGVTTVTYCTMDALGNEVCCDFTVTILDAEAPILNCPATQTVGLDGGECDQAYFFDVTATDNCPVDDIAVTLLSPCDPATSPITNSIECNNGVATTYYDLMPVAAPFDLTSLDVLTWNGGAISVNVYDATGETNADNFATLTLLGSGVGTGLPAMTVANIALTGSVPAGVTQILVEVVDAGLGIDFAVAVSNCGGGGTSTWIGGCVTPPAAIGTIGFGALDIAIQLNGSIAQELEVIPNPNAAAGVNDQVSGDLLPIGTHCWEYIATDVAGNTSTCGWCVTITEHPGPYANLNCNTGNNFSVDENCEVIICADDVLEGGPYRCYESYNVTVGGLSPATAIVGNGTTCVTIKASQLDGWNGMSGEFTLEVTDPNDANNSCWNGGFMIEDKFAPQITCPDPITISCTASTEPGPDQSGTAAASLAGPDAVGVSWGDGTTGAVGSASLALTIPAGAKVDDVVVGVDLDHSWMGDVTIDLTSPSGTTVNLLTGGGPCANADNMSGTFSTAGAAAACNAVTTAGNHENCEDPALYTTGASLSGDILAAGIASLAGENAGGTWTVSFTDGVGGDGGCVQNLSVSVDWTIFGIEAPVIFENCGQFTTVTEDVITDGDCTAGDAFAQIIERTHTVTDQKGNSASCTQIINVEFAKVADLILPSNYDNLDLPALDCSNANTDPSNTGSPAGGCDNIGFTYDDVQIDICEGSYKILRHFTILDWCTGEIIHHYQTIKVLDTTGPTIDCPANINESTTTNSCEGNVFIALPAVSDDCSSAANVSLSATSSAGTLSQQAGGYIVYGLPIGTHSVTFTAEDDCGNTNSCTTNITITDDINPVAICETFHNVSLTIAEPTLVPANVFDDGSYDNCSGITMDVRRMDSCIDFDWTTAGAGNDELPNGIVNNADKGTGPTNSQTSGWYPAVPFACCDVNNTVQVVFRVTDAVGNRNTCMVNITVEDKIAPVIDCPEDETYECSEYYNEPADLPLNGVSATGSGAPAYYVSLNGPGNADNDTTFVGYYANAYDNCEATVYIQDLGQFNSCGVTVNNAGNPSFIQRRFTVRDAGGLTDLCVQRLYVINSTPYTGPLSFPNDYDTNTCGAGLDPSVTGEPNISNDNTCSLVSFTHEDIELPITENSCMKILRTWHVYDWCQYDIDPSTGYWTDTQVIKVLNSEAPTITSCGSQDFCINEPANNANCLANVSLSITAEDDCSSADELNYTYWVDFDNDGTQDLGGSSSTYNDNDVAVGTHSISWTVEDNCGNVSTCSYTFEVEDCQGPTVYAYNGLAVDLNQQGQVTLWASDFDAGSFDICSGVCDIRINSPSGGPGQTAPPTTAGHTFDCDDLGTQTVDLWVKDCANNWSYVSTYIVVEDNNTPPACTGAPQTASISGGVTTEMAENVEDVSVEVTGNAPGIPDMVYTNNSGQYGVPGLPVGYNYQVTPALDENPLNGVSTYDLVLISKHILSIEDLDSPYKMIAADINKSGSITTFDMVELRKMILFINTEFPNNTSWRFVEANFVFPTATNPWLTIFPEVSDFNGLSSNELADYVGVKVGDVNGSAIPNSLVGGDDRTTVGDLVFAVENTTMVAGEEYTVDFTAKDFANVMGYQFTLAFNDAVEVLDVTAGELAGMTDANFGLNKINEGVITTSWNASEAAKMNDNDVVFSVTFKANSAAQLSDVMNISSRYTVAEAYNAELELMNVAIEYNQNGEVAATSFDLYQNTPNPFKDATVISFTLPEASAATLKVYDVSGKVLKSVEANYAKGYNEVTITRSDLSGSGVLYYTLETATDSATKKMIIVD